MGFHRSSHFRIRHPQERKKCVEPPSDPWISIFLAWALFVRTYGQGKLRRLDDVAGLIRVQMFKKSED